MGRYKRELKSEAIQLRNVRELYGLSPLKRAKRPCLKCNEAFVSEGIHNRVCNTCTYENNRVELGVEDIYEF